jgi:hypothetical protein
MRLGGSSSANEFSQRRFCYIEIWVKVARHVHGVQGRKPERACSDRPCYILENGEEPLLQRHLFCSLKGSGFKANYRNQDTWEEYWISGPRRDGKDRLHVSNIPVEIDEDVREEYWSEIRKKPELKNRPQT